MTTTRTRPGATAAATRRIAERRRQAAVWTAGIAALLAVGGTLAYLSTQDGGQSPSGGVVADGAPRVGGDLHTVTAVGDAIYVGGHESVALSRDRGETWGEVPSLTGADAMGWAVTEESILVGGHPGLFRSTDGGSTFTPLTDGSAVPDVHAVGAAGSTLYAASPQAGLLTSRDEGRSWAVVSPETGRSFMGTILVDPQDPDRLIAPDMATGLTQSTDGGLTWQPLGGPTGAMAATWNPVNVDEIVAVGMNGAGRSDDGGRTWQQLELPAATTAVTYSEDGGRLYAGVLDGDRAVLHVSTDDGDTGSTPS